VQATVRVTASALNVRKDASAGAEIIGQVKKGTALGVLATGDSWTMVKLPDGEVGWVASRFVEREGAAGQAKPKRRKGCPADSDYAFLEAPKPSFSEGGAHGLVVIEANVNAKGTVTSTRIVSNGTGDEALAFLAEREIKQSKFEPPIRNCAPKGFVFTYRRAF
jgi:TonB family protein